MKKLPDKTEIVERIIVELGRPLRQHRSKAEASAAVEAVEGAIKTLRVKYGRPRPDAGSIRKAAKNLRKALEPLSGAMPIVLKGCCFSHMWLQDLRSNLDWLESTDGPSSKFDSSKYLAALLAYGLVNEFSQKPPSTALGGQVREIGTLLYKAVSGKEGVDLKRQTDAACKNWRYNNEIQERARQSAMKERELRRELHEAYLEEARAIPGAKTE